MTTKPKGTRALASCQAAQRLEAALGDPASEASPVSFARVLEHDERETYPQDLHAVLDAWGLGDYYVPARLGGKQSSFEEFCHLLRVVSRRDPSLAIGHGITWVGSLPVMLSGSLAQQERAAALLRGRSRFAFMLTEREHGSDLQANETTARPSGTGHLLRGEKWLINNATLCDAFSVIARTGERESSVFFLEKRSLPAGCAQPLPKVRTLGVRAMDISGLVLRDAPAPAGALVGERGAGFEVILRSLQISRALSAPLCLGPLDTCLRATLEFAGGRVLYGKPVTDIGHARGVLLDAFLDALVLDCMGLAIARGAHVATEQLSVWSSVQKYFVPTRAQRALEALSVVLGARYYLREAHWQGMFQKMLRDNALVALFDGSTVVNLSLLGAQLPELARRRAGASFDQQTRAAAPRLRAMFDLGEPLPPFDPGRIRLSSETDDLVFGPWTVEAAPGDGEVAGLVRAAVAELRREIVALDGALLAARDGRAADTFDLARRHCTLHAASVCVLTWAHNRDALGPFFARGEWLVLALRRLFRELGLPAPEVPADFERRTWRHLLRLATENRQLSLFPIPLGRAPIPVSAHTAASHRRQPELASV